jgi:hypothetical protein
MVLQAASATFCLNKLTTLSFYVGTSSLKFNLLTNKFEKSSELISALRFLSSIAVNILYLIYANYFYYFQPSAVFILKITGAFYLYMLGFITFSITIINKKFESATVEVLNNLHRFELEVKGWQHKTSQEEIVVLSVFLCEVVLRFVTTFIFIFYTDSIIYKNNAKLFLEATGMLIIDYSGMVLALFEARFLLTYVVIAQHCDNFNNSLDKHETLDKYKDFLELVINTNKMFSSSFLVCVAFYFVSTLMRVVAIYCSIHDKMENIMNAVEIFILIFTAAKFVLIVVIPTGSMGKVKCNEWCLEAVDHTRFRLTK